MLQGTSSQVKKPRVGFSADSHSQALSQQLHQPPEMWETVIHIIPVPNIQVFPAEGADDMRQRRMLYVWIHEPQKPWEIKKK